MFIGEKEIKSIDGQLVTFVDGTVRAYPAKKTIEIDVMSYIVTEEPKDASAFVQLCVAKVAKDGLEVWRAHDVSKINTNRAIDLQTFMYDREFQIAVGKAFGTFETDKNPVGFEEEIRMSDFEKFNN